jgi:1,4-alpha-glucan branching enzyme
VHLILENDRNQARYLTRATDRAAPVCASAQWNDDFHHALHILTTGERDGYYCDYSERALWFLARTLAEGFAFQGEVSAHRGGQPRGEVSKQLPSTAFIIFTQTHDQVGNRAMGERIAGARPSERAAGRRHLFSARAFNSNVIYGRRIRGQHAVSFLLRFRC